MSSASDSGVREWSNGRSGLAKISLQPKAKCVPVDYAVTDEWPGKPGISTRLLIAGISKDPTLIYNGKPAKPTHGEKPSTWMVTLE